MTKKELLREAAEDCVELSNYLVNDAPNMGFTKEKRYREQAAQCLKRAEELNKWADSLPVEPACEHDLQKPNHTLTMTHDIRNGHEFDSTAQCRVCGRQFVHPLHSALRTSDAQ